MSHFFQGEEENSPPGDSALFGRLFPLFFGLVLVLFKVTREGINKHILQLDIRQRNHIFNEFSYKW